MSSEHNRDAETYEMDEEIAVKEKLNPKGDLGSPSKVKFTAANDGKNGEAKVDVENGYGGSVGMNKEELMKYANDPFWVRLRMFLFILFWVVWFAMLIGAIVIIAVAPRCPATSSLPWWQKTTVYQVYVRSFKDSNGDGEGDIRGLINKLDYLKDIGIETIILSPVYPSPMKDSGYDVSDYNDIDPRYGTLEDFENLVEEMHKEKNNMKLIIDFIPNHTSDQHRWFQASKRNETEFADFYVWHDGQISNGERKPPNNWKSAFGGSAWTWSEEREKYYLHQFLDKQPDLNLRNPEVQKALKDVLLFWLKKKVDGIRIDAVSHLFEDANFEDEEVIETKAVGNDYDTLKHDKTKGQPENYELLREWRKIVKQTGLKKIIVSEAYEPMEQLVKYYGTSTDPVVELPFNFNLLDVNLATKASELKQKIQSWIHALHSLNWSQDPKSFGPWSAWVTGNHDKSRLVNRLDHRLADALMMVTFLLPRNTPIVYYGDEIGMSDNNDIPDKAMNEGDSSRYAYRSPMQWNSQNPSAGFSDNDTTVPWLNVPASHTQYNVEVEANVNTTSHLKVFKSLVSLRKAQAETILLGETNFPDTNNTDLFVMARILKEHNSYLLAVNMNTSTMLTVKIDEPYLPSTGKIYLADSGSPVDLIGKEVNLSELQLQPSQSILIEFAAQE